MTARRSTHDYTRTGSRKTDVRTWNDAYPFRRGPKLRTVTHINEQWAECPGADLGFYKGGCPIHLKGALMIKRDIRSFCHLVSTAENSEAIEKPFAFWTRVDPRERLITYSGLLRVNTVLCSFNTIQPSSWNCNYLVTKITITHHWLRQTHTPSILCYLHHLE